ncbi:MAG: DUF6597 domain-containing transcriptional factor [Bacteroidota bacterium]
MILSIFLTLRQDMDYRIVKPSAALAPYVKHYWMLDDCLPKGREHIQRIVPSGLAELIFYLGDRPGSKDRQKPLSDNVLITGQLNEFYDLEVKGSMSLFSIVFLPYSLSLFFDVPAVEFNNRHTPLRFLVRDGINRLEDRIFEATSMHHKVAIAETFLMSRMQKSGKKFEFQRVFKAVETINLSRGQVDIETLASAACLSRKQFERTFAAFVGIVRMESD